MTRKSHLSVPSSAAQPATSSAAQPTSELRRRTSSSAARSAASRRNAQKSTGPRTAEGKARVSQNALKHGLFSQATLDLLAAPQRAEERAEYEELVAGVHDSFQPVSRIEKLLADRLADQYWRLNWLKTQRDLYLEPNDTKRYGAWYYVENAMPFTQEETRIENSILKLQRNLIFLQRWRNGELQPGRMRAPEPTDSLSTSNFFAPPAAETVLAPAAAIEPTSDTTFARESATRATPRHTRMPSFPMPDQTVALDSGKQSQDLLIVLQGIAKELGGLP